MDWCLPVFAPCVLSVLGSSCISVLICLGGKVDNMRKLEENIGLLRDALKKLIEERDDVVTKVNVGVLKGGKPQVKVSKWLSEVETIETETNLLLAEASGQYDASADVRPSTSGCLSTDNISTCVLGEEVFKKLNEVRALSSRREKFDVLIMKEGPPVVEVKPCQQTFGLDSTLEKTWRSLMDDETRILSVYGMGGVGKTTLLTLINNKFVDFDVVIWVQVSKDVDIAKIQDDIGKRLCLCDENWLDKSQSEKAGDIQGVLSHRKPRFVLLLDDLWEEVSLTAIGVPLHGREYRVVFTTRFKDVCARMNKFDGIEVECLKEKDAWDLFKQNAGGLNDDFSDIAKKIAAECCGLPLALVVIGQSLSSKTKTTVDEWRRALSILKSSSPSELKGTEKGIFQVLKLSYDSLGEKDAKCFQYCALFPKAYKIRKDELVEYWIGEGFIDEKDGRQTAEDRGYGIIEALVGSGLLLEDGESKQKVYMHNMIREMALWIVSKFEEGEVFVVQAGAGLNQIPKVKNWRPVTKMSLMNNEIKSIHYDPAFYGESRLITLFLQNNRLVNIVGLFFAFMSTLVVLDLSCNPGLTVLPEQISMLIALRYLNLSGTSIKSLPYGLGNMIELIHLDLESTSNLRSISLVSGLLKLQVLRFYRSAPLDHTLLENLERLEDLKLLTITVEKDFKVLESFLGSNSAGHTQGLYLDRLQVSGVSFADTFGALGSLSKLKMTECDIIESETEWEDNRRSQYSPSSSSNQITPSNALFKNLSALVLVSCVRLRDLSWLIYAENLESLSIALSPKMEEIISKEKAAGVSLEPFLKLQVLHLSYMDELRSICWSPLSLPRLQKVHVVACPKLLKLR